MLLRNMQPPKKVNGTRLVVTKLMNNLLEAKIITGNCTEAWWTGYRRISAWYISGGIRPPWCWKRNAAKITAYPRKDKCGGSRKYHTGMVLVNWWQFPRSLWKHLMTAQLSSQGFNSFNVLCNDDLQVSRPNYKSCWPLPRWAMFFTWSILGWLLQGWKQPQPLHKSTR